MYPAIPWICVASFPTVFYHLYKLLIERKGVGIIIEIGAHAFCNFDFLGLKEHALGREMPKYEWAVAIIPGKDTHAIGKNQLPNAKVSCERIYAALFGKQRMWKVGTRNVFVGLKVFVQNRVFRSEEPFRV